MALSLPRGFEPEETPCGDYDRAKPGCIAFARMALLAAFFCLAVFDAARGNETGAGIAAPTDAQQAAAGDLDEDAAVRFIASIGPMRRLGRSIAARAAVIETNLDDPLMPYAHLSPEQLARETEIGPLLARHGFSDITEWLGIGEPLMRAYYHVSGNGQDDDWARQIVGVLARIQGLDQLEPSERAAKIARLLADLHARRDAELPPKHIEIARKFRHSLELATDGTIK